MTVLSPVACIAEHKVNAGMPLLVEAANERAISPFEFLPSWFCYAPVVVQSVLLGLYYRASDKRRDPTSRLVAS